MSREVNLGQIVPNIQVGATRTITPKESANVINVGTSLNPIFDFYIPKGDPGAISLLIVNELPLVGSEDTLYFVPKTDTEESDMYDEYVWINNHWELVGTKQITVDLSDYYTKTETNSLLNGKTDAVKTLAGYTSQIRNNGNNIVLSNISTSDSTKSSGVLFTNGNFAFTKNNTELISSNTDGKLRLYNVKDPENDGDAVNKKYVDDTIDANSIDVQVNNTSIISNNVANILTEGVYGVRNKLLTKGYADARYVLEETIDDNVGYMYISPNIKDDKDVDFSINVQSNLDSEASADMNFGVEYDEGEGKGHGYFRLRLYDAGSIEIDNNGTKITKVITPTNDEDAVNKLYVDSLVGDIGTILDNINGEVIGG